MIQKPNPILPTQPQNFYRNALLQWSGVLDAVMVKSKYAQAISNRLYLYDCVVNLIRLRGKKIPVLNYKIPADISSSAFFIVLNGFSIVPSLSSEPSSSTYHLLNDPLFKIILSRK